MRAGTSLAEILLEGKTTNNRSKRDRASADADGMSSGYLN